LSLTRVVDAPNEEAFVAELPSREALTEQLEGLNRIAIGCVERCREARDYDTWLLAQTAARRTIGVWMEIQGRLGGTPNLAARALRTELDEIRADAGSATFPGDDLSSSRLTATVAAAALGLHGRDPSGWRRHLLEQRACCPRALAARLEAAAPPLFWMTDLPPGWRGLSPTLGPSVLIARGVDPRMTACLPASYTEGEEHDLAWHSDTLQTRLEELSALPPASRLPHLNDLRESYGDAQDAIVEAARINPLVGEIWASASTIARNAGRASEAEFLRRVAAIVELGSANS
jgi:hypothetical protein